jgi:hydroxymethylbilane synthase
VTDVLRIATRGSRLARWQADWVAALHTGPTEIVLIETTGDRETTEPIHAIGGTGVFVKEVQQAVLEGRADIAVHSAKDLPAETPADLVIAAVPVRADARDALVGARLADLTSGFRVATGSVRRRAQLAAVQPGLVFSELRGNIDTRLAKAADFDAIVVAAAALDRLGLTDRATESLAVDVMLPQVGQGALAIECRADDQETRASVKNLDDAVSHRVLDTERGFLNELGGGCSLPCAGFAWIAADGRLEFAGLVSALDGSQIARATARGDDADALGRAVARRVLDDEGGRELLAALENP